MGHIGLYIYICIFGSPDFRKLPVGLSQKKGSRKGRNMSARRPSGFRISSSATLASVPKVRCTPPHPVIVTIRDYWDYIRVLLCSNYTTITGWGVLLNLRKRNFQKPEDPCFWIYYTYMGPSLKVNY